MTDLKRISPISFTASPASTESRNQWEVVLTYENESAGSGLVDLSHWFKWDIQETGLSDTELEGIGSPKEPGDVILHDGFIVNRLNPAQTVIWQYDGQVPAWTKAAAVTDVTDAFALIGIYGPPVGRIVEKVTTLDIGSPGRTPPFFLQGPVLHLPMHVLVFQNDGGEPGVLMACARGYGQTVVDALLDAGSEFDLRPAGEGSFFRWIEAGGEESPESA